MPCISEDRLRVVAVIHTLKAAGVRVKNWKNISNGESTHGQTFNQESQLNVFAFGRDLPLLPQCQLIEMGGTVPQFLVDSCEYLSQHLHTEGLFRKTGSLTRIRALRAVLEQGQPVFSPPQSATLRPCDVASLLKQFLRELPCPLIPADLQGPLCEAQGLEVKGDLEGGRDRATLLVTALFPASHARVLRYFCSFLSRAAQRCSENRMEAGSLALVIAPNLLQCTAGPSKLTTGTERQLDRQAAVIKALITYADRIGVIPSFILDVSGVEEPRGSTPPADRVAFCKRAGLSVYRSLRRQRRRSVGEIFVDAFSKLKPGRTPSAPSNTTDGLSANQISKSPTPQSPITIKRKATEDTLPHGEGSAKKRRSLHDLRGDNQSSERHSDESTGTQSPRAVKQRAQMRDHRRLQRRPSQEDTIQQRKKCLWFFTPSSSSSPVTTTTAGNDPANWLMGSKMASANMNEPPSSELDAPSRIPFILIDGPGRVVVGSEADDDSDLLICSFAEDPDDDLRSGTEASPVPTQEMIAPSKRCEDAGTPVKDRNSDGAAGCEGTTGAIQTVARHDDTTQRQGEGVHDTGEEQPYKEPNQKVRPNHRRPRRSISMPEVTLEQASSPDEVEEAEDEAGTRFRDRAELHDAVWSASQHVPGLPERGSRQNESEGKETLANRAREGEEMERESETAKKPEKSTESGLVFKRMQQRTAVGERLRGFSALAVLLRTSRAAPQLRETREVTQGTVRLRRQGARRFGRSISHESAPWLPPGRSPICDQEETRCLDKPGDPSQYLPLEPEEPGDLSQYLPLEPEEPDDLSKYLSLEPRVPVDPSQYLPLEPEEPADPSQHLPFDPLPLSHQSHQEQGLETQSPPLNNLARTLHDLRNPTASPERSQDPHSEQSEECLAEPHLKCMQLEQLEKPKEQPGESDLYKLLEKQCHIGHPGEEHSQDLVLSMQLQMQPQIDVPHDALSLVSFKQEILEDVPPSLVPLQPLTGPDSPRESKANPLTPSQKGHIDFRSNVHRELGADSPYKVSPRKGSPPLSLDGLIDMENSTSDRCSVSVDCSPPAFRFRPPATRRQYRDSPRWPTPEIRVATWNAVQL